MPYDLVSSKEFVGVEVGVGVVKVKVWVGLVQIKVGIGVTR